MQVAGVGQRREWKKPKPKTKFCGILPFVGLLVEDSQGLLIRSAGDDDGFEVTLGKGVCRTNSSWGIGSVISRPVLHSKTFRLATSKLGTRSRRFAVRLHQGEVGNLVGVLARVQDSQDLALVIARNQTILGGIQIRWIAESGLELVPPLVLGEGVHFDIG
ncbi:unnamed protein product [Periconia digitata]|uniref:Uncharacterized protein n=1 Tax=Periconia digitata TaxID=1303443 RepID=A0A9W4U2F4_9PLEO|nr:unnamed protein product [Periconia digitata]